MSLFTDISATLPSSIKFLSSVEEISFDVLRNRKNIPITAKTDKTIITVIRPLVLDLKLI